MKILILTYGFFAILYACTINAKTITNTHIWGPNTHIYQVNMHIKGQVQVEEFTPMANLQGLKTIKSFLVPLPTDVTIQDVAVLSEEEPRLFVLTASGQLLVINMATQNISFSFSLPDCFGKVITPIKIIAKQQTKKMFFGAQMPTGPAILEIDIDNLMAQQPHKLAMSSIKDFSLLAMSKKHALNAFAIYNDESLWLQPYTDDVQELSLTTANTKGENIQQVIIGPAIISPDFSWYMVNKSATGNYLTSNNFTQRIALPNNVTIFLKHGELVFFSAAENKLFSINSRTGKTQELTILRAWQQQYNHSVAEENVDFLFWEPVQKQQVLFSDRNKQLYIRQFELSFDTPKILSWRKENVW